jgi:hypothetical protein
MPREQRKNVRRALSYPAQVDIGDNSPPRQCMLNDVSEDGAQIAIEDASGLPNLFILIMGFDGTARRRCRVIWRSETRIGVEFVGARQLKPEPVAQPDTKLVRSKSLKRRAAGDR